MSRIEQRFLEKLGDSWESATPGFCVQAFSQGKKIVDIEVGQTYPIYDWASVTKIIFTTTALMSFLDEKRFRLADPVSQWVEWFPEDSGVRLKTLLSHSAGLTWWYPFYKTVAPKTEGLTPEEAWFVFEKVLKSRVLRDLKKRAGEKSREPIQAVYSDLDFFLLGAALQRISGESLYETWSDLRERMGLKGTDFLRGNQPKRALKSYAPTESCKWRGGVIQGQAHDENTWSLRGVAPHAGLFGPIDDLGQWGLLLRKAMRGEKTRAFPSPETVRLFTRRSIPRSQGDWGLGFMMPTKGAASCGPLFSLSSVGHTGFTGTSLWFDPKRDLLVTILSNRVHPTRDNREFVTTLRKNIHTWIAEEI